MANYKWDIREKRQDWGGQFGAFPTRGDNNYYVNYWRSQIVLNSSYTSLRMFPPG